MNAVACQQVMEGVGSGVAASLRAVDCAASATAQAAFGRLFGTGSNGEGGALIPALTVLLTLYVAFFAFALITGRSRLGVSALTPRMITLGMVLTFATSWIAYQSVVWNLAVGAPDQLAAILTGVQGSSTQVFADKIDVVLGALVQASTGSEASAAPASTFSPEGMLWLGGTLLLLGTVGVLATCKIALAILLALGPVFVVLALFQATRGLFTGWLKGVVMLAIAPLFAVLGGSLMLELAVPVLRALTAMPGQIDARAAMAFFMIGTVHVALMVMVLKVAGSMVAGWTVFGLARPASSGRDEPAAGAARAVPAAAAQPAPDAARAAATMSARGIKLAPTTITAANDSGPGGTGSIRRETRIVGGGTPLAAAGGGSPSRSRGVGSRFRTAVPHPKLARSTEKFR